MVDKSWLGLSNPPSPKSPYQAQAGLIGSEWYIVGSRCLAGYRKEESAAEVWQWNAMIEKQIARQLPMKWLSF